jgi:hypothetical protein
LHHRWHGRIADLAGINPLDRIGESVVTMRCRRLKRGITQGCRPMAPHGAWLALFFLLAACGSKLAQASTGDETWHLRTDDTALTLEARQGKVLLTELGSASHDENWLEAPVSETLLPSVAQQGVATATSWRYEGATKDVASGELVLSFSNA